jgi:hypothetical protein
MSDEIRSDTMSYDKDTSTSVAELPGELPESRDSATLAPAAPTAHMADKSNSTLHGAHTSRSTHTKGARAGNTNAQRHGLRSSRLPKGCASITNSTGELRASLEAELRTRGPINTYQAALVQSAIRHESRAQLLARWLRLATDAETTSEGQTTKMATGSETSTQTRKQGLGVLDKASLLRDISAATDARDKCIERLGLDQTEALQPWQIPATAEHPA